MSPLTYTYASSAFMHFNESFLIINIHSLSMPTGKDECINCNALIIIDDPWKGWVVESSGLINRIDIVYNHWSML